MFFREENTVHVVEFWVQGFLSNFFYGFWDGSHRMVCCFDVFFCLYELYLKQSCDSQTSYCTRGAMEKVRLLFIASSNDISIAKHNFDGIDSFVEVPILE